MIQLQDKVFVRQDIFILKFNLKNYALDRFCVCPYIKEQMTVIPKTDEFLKKFDSKNYYQHIFVGVRAPN